MIVSADDSAPSACLGSAIEVYGLAPPPAGRIRCALFDFDGTLSLLRGGWQQVMTDHFVGILATAETAETTAQLAANCREFITRLTGEQTIYQMLQLEQEMRKRGAKPQPAAEYKIEYLARLGAHMVHRVNDLRVGREKPEAYMVRGSVSLLQRLRQAGIACYLASGTDHRFVVEETELLGLASHFSSGSESRIYGALDDYRSFSKRMVIERILERHNLSGDELVAFGDGYVEIEDCRRAGGVAVGVASLESGAEGWDMWKKNRLLEVGAHVLVPDWSEADTLLGYLGIR